MQKRGIVVLGVSADSVKSHQIFADKYGLNFPLLADTDTAVSQLYDV
jgi:thioredoxin-dependent peroxiredoxin